MIPDQNHHSEGTAGHVRPKRGSGSVEAPRLLSGGSTRCDWARSSGNSRGGGGDGGARTGQGRQGDARSAHGEAAPGLWNKAVDGNSRGNRDSPCQYNSIQNLRAVVTGLFRCHCPSLSQLDQQQRAKLYEGLDSPVCGTMIHPPVIQRFTRLCYNDSPACGTTIHPPVIQRLTRLWYNDSSVCGTRFTACGTTIDPHVLRLTCLWYNDSPACATTIHPSVVQRLPRLWYNDSPRVLQRFPPVVQRLTCLWYNESPRVLQRFTCLWYND